LIDQYRQISLLMAYFLLFSQTPKVLFLKLLLTLIKPTDKLF